MDENPYKSPAAPNDEIEGRNVKAPFTVPIPQSSLTDLDYRFRRRLAVRVWVGIFGGQLLSAASWSVIAANTQDRALAGQQYLPTMAVGAVIVGSLTYSRFAFLRVVAWIIGGLGTGLAINACILIDDRMGAWLTPTGLLLGCVFAIIGYRMRPLHGDTRVVPPENPI